VRTSGLVWLAGILLVVGMHAILAQTSAAAQTPAPQVGPIAIVPIDSSNPDQAATVTGALEVTGGKAIIAGSGSVTAAGKTTRVILPHRGELQICASTTVKLAADSNVASGETAGLLLAMDHGAVEMSFAGGAANLQNADVLLTPDFRIMISGSGAAEVKVRLAPQGDTCVDNAVVPGDADPSQASTAGANGPYVLVSSVFDGGAYRVQPGQRVMFQHGSLREVVDQEEESCGCPPAAPKGNEFPVAQSMGLAPLPTPAPSPALHGGAISAPVAPMVYRSADHAPPTAAAPESGAMPAVSAKAPVATAKAATKKPGFFRSIGRFFRRIFGAE